LNWFKEIRTDILAKHTEDHFDDFDQEGLISKHLSKEGPALAVGDVNNDGAEDVFVGGARGQAGAVYLHKGGGKLQYMYSECFIEDAGFEDTAATFFDVDGDGDLDLVVGSGGNIAAERNVYQPRLYLNNGKGEFSRSAHNLPVTKTNISVLAVK